MHPLDSTTWTLMVLGCEIERTIGKKNRQQLQPASTTNSPAPAGEITVYEATAFNGSYPCLRVGQFTAFNNWSMSYVNPK